MAFVGGAPHPLRFGCVDADMGTAGGDCVDVGFPVCPYMLEWADRVKRHLPAECGDSFDVDPQASGHGLYSLFQHARQRHQDARRFHMCRLRRQR